MRRVALGTVIVAVVCLSAAFLVAVAGRGLYPTRQPLSGTPIGRQIETLFEEYGGGRPGAVTFDRMVELLGPPHKVSRRGNGVVYFAYDFRGRPRAPNVYLFVSVNPYGALDMLSVMEHPEKIWGDGEWKPWGVDRAGAAPATGSSAGLR